MGVALVLLSLVLLMPRLMDYQAAEAEFESYGHLVESSGASYSEADGEVSFSELEVPEVDIEAARVEVSPETVAWIEIPKTRVSYPVVQGEDNRYYVRRSPSGPRRSSGSIFMDYKNNPDISQNRNTIIYGHNMRNGSMFAAVPKYSSQSYLKAHQVVYYTDEHSTYTIRIIGAYITNGSDQSVRQFDFVDEAHFQSYLDQQMSRTVSRIDVDTSEVTQIVQLSTCSYSIRDGRTILIGIVEHVTPR